MTPVTVDADFLARFHNLKEMLEVRDDQGRVLGYYAPLRSNGSSAYGGVEVPFAEEELARWEREPGGRSLDEILADLGKKS